MQSPRRVFKFNICIPALPPSHFSLAFLQESVDVFSIFELKLLFNCCEFNVLGVLIAFYALC